MWENCFLSSDNICQFSAHGHITLDEENLIIKGLDHPGSFNIVKNTNAGKFGQMGLIIRGELCSVIHGNSAQCSMDYFFLIGHL